MTDLTQATARSTITLTGALDSRTSHEVREQLYAHLDAHTHGDVLVDLRGVTRVDATAVRVLAAAALRSERRGQHVVLVGASERLRRAVAYSGCRRLFAWE